MLYFFLSYGWTSDDEYVELFFDELREEVRNQTGSRRDAEIGFLDRVSIRQDRLLWDEIGRALAECRVFVPLLSPRLLRSVYCGREWAAFQRRLDEQRETDGRQVDGLLPVLWRPCGELPPAVVRHENRWSVSNADNADFSLSTLYKRRGESYWNSRTLFVEQIASEIVRIAESELVAGDELLNVPALPSVFAHVDSLTELPPPDVQRGPTHLNAVIAAAGTADVRRRKKSCYGARIRDWRPYHPHETRVAEVIDACSEEQDFHPDLYGVSQLGERLTDARGHNEAVALFADPWAPSVDGHGEQLVDFDRLQSRSTPLFVPWSLEDTETQERRATLVEQLVRLMPLAHEDGLVSRDDMGTLDAFERAVSAEIGLARAHVLRTARPVRTVPGEQPPEPPVIEVS